MTTISDVEFAVLAMDAYNRDYNGLDERAEGRDLAPRSRADHGSWRRADHCDRCGCRASARPRREGQSLSEARLGTKGTILRATLWAKSNPAQIGDTLCGLLSVVELGSPPAARSSGKPKTLGATLL